MVRSLRIHIKERGNVPRKMRVVYSKASKVAWGETGKLFHSDMRDDRFSWEHGRVARYLKRTEKYEKYKEKKFGHNRPLEFTGETRRAVKTANIVATRNGSRVRYSGARKFNFRPRGGVINMSKEFRKLTAKEKAELGKKYDSELNEGLNSDSSTHSEVI